MSADKFLPESNNYISFVAGERLDAEKLNTLIQIIESQIEDIGGVVGDARSIFLDPSKKHSSFFPTNKTTSDKVVEVQKNLDLDISNLSRLIGPASALNPRVINHADSKTFYEVIPAGQTGLDLKFGKSCEITIVAGYEEESGSISFNSSERVYKIENGRVLLNQTNTSSTVVIYTFKPESFWGTLLSKTNSSYNVIPDPNASTNNGNKLTITYNSNEENYTISLPNADYEHINSNLESQELGINDINTERQIKLPEYIIDQYGVGDILPKYSVILKNKTLDEVYISCEYIYVDESTIKIQNIGLGDQNCIDGYDFCLLTVGTDITTAIADIRNKLEAHSHDGSFGEKRISIYELGELFDEPGEKGIFGVSSLKNNPIPQYLHRDGYQEDSTHENANNAMRGNLRLGNEAFDTLNASIPIETNTGNSVSLELGSGEDSISLNSGRLTIESTNSNDDAGIDITSSKNIVSEAGTEIVDSINSQTITVKKDIEPNFNFVDSFTGATFSRSNNILVRETKDVVEVNDWTTFELSPNTSRRPEDYAMPSQEASDGVYYFQNRDVSLKTNGVSHTITPWYERSYKYTVVPIEEIVDNFYFKLNKVAFRNTASSDSGIYSGEIPEELTKSYHAYSIQDPSSYDGQIAGPYFEDVGDDIVEDPNVRFYYISLREKIEDVNNTEQARPSLHNPQSSVEYSDEFIWVETSARYALNPYFSITEIQGGVGDNVAKRALWPWFSAGNPGGDLESFSIAINLNLLPSDDSQDFSYEKERHLNTRRLIEKNMGILVEREIEGNKVYRWVDNSKFGLTNVVSYEDEETTREPDANLLTRLKLDQFTKEELLIRGDEGSFEITNTQELYDLLEDKKIKIYFTRRHINKDTCGIPVNFVKENDSGKYPYYYDFNEVLSEGITKDSKRTYSFAIGGTKHVDDWSFIASNRFFVLFHRDATAIASNKIVKRKFILDLVEEENRYVFKFYRKDSNQIFLVESPQVVFRYIKENAADNNVLVEKDYLETYNKGGVSGAGPNYNILVSINGENIFAGKVFNVSITQMIFEYIRRRMRENTRSELGDSAFSVEFFDGVESPPFQLPNTGIFGMHCIVKGEEIIVGNKIILNIELDYTLEKSSEDTNGFAFKYSENLPTIGLGG